MKSAEALAKDFIGIVTQGIKRGVPYDESRDLIAQALTAFAEERVKEALRAAAQIANEVDADQLFEMARMTRGLCAAARAEALEEAAKVADYFTAPGKMMGEKIRALKANP